MIAGDRKIVYETEASFDKLDSEDWVAPWTRYFMHLVSKLMRYSAVSVASLLYKTTQLGLVGLTTN